MRKLKTPEEIVKIANAEHFDSNIHLVRIVDRIIKIAQRDALEFAAEGVKETWANLQKQTFEVYDGFNKTPLDQSERFFGNDCYD